MDTAAPTASRHLAAMRAEPPIPPAALDGANDVADRDDDRELVDVLERIAFDLERIHRIVILVATVLVIVALLAAAAVGHRFAHGG